MVMQRAADHGSGAQDRIQFLDGLRGVAILWVMLFHSYVRWPEFFPFGNRYSGQPLLAYGWLGVQLFFLISGFVIFMTLERSTSFGNFIWRRWLRLFPAMLLCSIFIFVTAGIFHERPAGAVRLLDLLPGLIFTDPQWLYVAFGFPGGPVEGAFWTLFVEVKFYVVAGLLYFSVGGKKAIAGLLALFSLWLGLLVFKRLQPAVDIHEWQYIMQFFAFQYFGWFAAGALFFRYVQNQDRSVLAFAVLVAVASAAAENNSYQRYVPLLALSVVVAFTAGVVSKTVQRLLSNRVVLLLGFVSYPLYLVHENMLVASIIKLGHAAPWMPPALIPILPMLWVTGVAWLVARFAEPWLREKLRGLVRMSPFSVIHGSPR
jgi:peptidoglycan/LPS O-acetylase OafA/YrhL